MPLAIALRQHRQQKNRPHKKKGRRSRPFQKLAVNCDYLRVAQAYMLISMPTQTSAIFGVFQAMIISLGSRLHCRLRFEYGQAAQLDHSMDAISDPASRSAGVSAGTLQDLAIGASRAAIPKAIRASSKQKLLGRCLAHPLKFSDGCLARRHRPVRSSIQLRARSADAKPSVGIVVKAMCLISSAGIPSASARRT